MPDAAALSALPDPAALPAAIAASVNRALGEIGLVWKREAVRNAPRSPKTAEIRTYRKARWDAKGKKPTKAQKAAWKKRVNPRAKSRPAPGGLERSVETATRAVSPDFSRSEVAVFVSAGSEAGKYARRIHDEKGKTWRNRGPGTVAKGARADEKFIERAMLENDAKFQKKIADALARAVEEAMLP